MTDLQELKQTIEMCSSNMVQALGKVGTIGKQFQEHEVGYSDTYSYPETAHLGHIKDGIEAISNSIYQAGVEIGAKSKINIANAEVSVDLSSICASLRSVELAINKLQTVIENQPVPQLDSLVEAVRTIAEIQAQQLAVQEDVGLAHHTTLPWNETNYDGEWAEDLEQGELDLTERAM